MNFDIASLRINATRLGQRLQELGQIGANADGICRLALSAEDGAGRDLVLRWMRELGLLVSIDAMGNVVGVRAGTESGPPVMTGSHIDTVATGGRYDGNLRRAGRAGGGALAPRAKHRVTRGLWSVAAFTNEEGVRFQPDMMGSLVHAGGLPLDAGAGHRRHRRHAAWATSCSASATPATGLRRDRAARLCRTAHRAGAGDGGRGRADRRGAGPAGHLVAGVHRVGPVQPRRHHADALRRDAGHGAAAIAVFVREMARATAAARSPPWVPSSCIPTWST
jgi:N-carbamoyl-L-amino-acid hydrolase